MNQMPPKLKSILLSDPRYKRCARYGVGCAGRVTWEHAFMYAGKQVQEAWNIVPLCWEHHLGAKLDKSMNYRLAAAQATPEDRARYPRIKWSLYA